MKIALDKFEEWLRNKNLKERTLENYVYYFNKFTFDVYNQETVSRFLSDKTNRNSIARSFLVNFQKFLMVNYKELGFSQDSRVRIAEVELPKLTGRNSARRSYHHYRCIYYGANGVLLPQRRPLLLY